MDIVCLGELLIDMFPAEVGRHLTEVSAFRPNPGGAPANVAVAATRLGTHSAFIGKVGDDAFGHHLKDVLQQESVETRGMRFADDARTTMAFIAMPDENTAEFVFYRNPGADMLLRPDELDRSLLQDTRALHIGTISLIDEPSRSATFEAIEVARAGGALISLDVNYRPSLWPDPDVAHSQIVDAIPHADVLKVNEGELTFLTGSEALGAGCDVLLEMGPSLCIVTLGPDGSYVQTAEGGVHVAGFQVTTVDAVGCGDAFVAGVLMQLVSDDVWQSTYTLPMLRRIVSYANAVGALTAQAQGVIPALPTADQVDKFLTSAGEVDQK